MKEFTIDLHDGRGNQVYVLKIDQLAALEAKVKEKDELIDHLENTILNPGEDINERGTATVLNQDYWFICSHREKKVMNERIAALTAGVQKWIKIAGENQRSANLCAEENEQWKRVVVTHVEEITMLKDELAKLSISAFASLDAASRF